MKHLKWLFLCASVFLCFSLVAPMNVDAGTKKSQTKVEKKLVKKSSSKKDKVSSRSVSVKSASKHKKSRADLKKPEKNEMKSGKLAERDIWLKRARESEVLTGKASWYGKDFHNKATASGIKYDMHTFTAAHRTLPMGTVVKVTDQHTGKSVMVCVTDRGPYARGRIIDLSYAAAKQLDMFKRGVAPVKLEVVSDEKGAPLKGGHAYFVSYGSQNGKSKVGPFHAFSDAAAMHEALRQAHPEAVLVLEKSPRPREK